MLIQKTIKYISKPIWRKYHNSFASRIYYTDGTFKRMSTSKFIMEQHLGRELTKDEVVTYIDGDSKNISLSNLKIISRSELSKRNGLKVYNNSDKKSKSHPDLILDYFKEINTKDKAYWLGFLFADGCLLDKNYRIQLGLKTDDIDSIKKFVSDIGGNLDCIKTVSSVRSLGGRPPKEYSTSYIAINNKIFYSYLLECGLSQNKTLSIRVPECILNNSKENIYAFIQGYFDGDGCLYKKDLHGSIVSGSELFLRDIMYLLNMNSKISKDNRSNAYQLNIPKTVLQELNDNYSDSMSRKRIPFGTNIVKKLEGHYFHGKPIEDYKDDLFSLSYKEFGKKYNCHSHYFYKLRKRFK